MDEVNNEVQEQILGEFGFVVRWAVRSHSAHFTAYDIAATDANGPWFETEEANGQTQSVASAEAYADGYVKWDGCTNITMGYAHWCGPPQFRKHIDLLKYLYRRAFELMEREQPEWEDPWPRRPCPTCGSDDWRDN